MVFLAGPRQVGKTTLSKSLVKRYDYLNWDVDSDRTRILKKEFEKSDLWIFDEIHKFKSWRSYLKGLFDQLGKDQKILVTGSAKLNEMRKGGDSLQGRYHFLRLMPLSVAELQMSSPSDIDTLFRLGGFPEPFFKGSQVSADRWTRGYQERIVRQEVSSLELFQDLARIEVLVERLPDVVGGLLSINSLAEDIQADSKTVLKWIKSLEMLYSIFRVAPFGDPKIKSLKKAQKLYFYDWNTISEDGPRFENFIAVHLLKWIFYLQDTTGRSVDLRYYRDKNDREVDFVIVEKNKPILLVECKYSQGETSRGIRYLKSLFPAARALQVSMSTQKTFVDGSGVEHCSALSFLQELV
ncbi:MAG: ATP-binding protein [Proteobacteria bacterium]|nr:ATP-binding protein [Pseudomonadota bacterium]